jgi:hypothetical protein
MNRTFRPSTVGGQIAAYGVASTGAAAGGAAAAESSNIGGRHIDEAGFLGLNWRSIGAAVVVGSLVAVGTDVALEIIRPILFGKKYRG